MNTHTRRNAIVTGGGTGIGRAITLHLARNGFDVAIIYSKSESDAKSTVLAANELGGRCIAYKADIADSRILSETFETIRSELGGIDWLINNAAITYQLPFADLEMVQPAMWSHLFSVNVQAAFELTRAAASSMIERGQGSVLNIGSIAGVTGFGSSVPYAVSKAAMHGLTRSLARALAPNIRVNAIAPGAVDTRWWSGNEDKMRLLAGTVPLERIPTPEDIAETAFMVLSSKAMTGQLVIVDSGQIL